MPVRAIWRKFECACETCLTHGTRRGRRRCRCSLAERVLELGFSTEAPEWLRAAAWVSKALQGLANAAVWSAPFLRKRVLRRLQEAAAEVQPLVVESDGTSTTVM